MISEGPAQLIVELPPRFHLNEESIEFGVKGVRNVLIGLGMTLGKIEYMSPRYFVDATCKLETIKGKVDGLWVSAVKPGELIRKGQKLGAVYSIFSYLPEQEVTAPFDGVVVHSGLPWKVFAQDGGHDGDMINVDDDIVSISTVLER